MDFTEHRDASSAGENDPTVEIQLAFEDKQKTEQSKSFINFNKQKASKERWKAVQAFIDAQEKFFDPPSDTEDFQAEEEQKEQDTEETKQQKTEEESKDT